MSTITDSGATVVPELPAASMMAAVSDHVPSRSVGRSHEVAVPTMYEQDTVAGPRWAVTVTWSPIDCPATDTAGLESDVRSSIADVPRSEKPTRSTDAGDGAVVSIVN